MTTFKMLIGEEMYRAKRGLHRNDQTDQPNKWWCPHCRNAKAKNKPVADLIQLGFEWDEHVTVFRCKCGKFFFAQYKIWHVGEEK